MKDKPLSEKSKGNIYGETVLFTEDVKEAVEKLKEAIMSITAKEEIKNKSQFIHPSQVFEEIDKIFGSFE